MTEQQTQQLLAQFEMMNKLLMGIWEELAHSNGRIYSNDYYAKSRPSSKQAPRVDVQE